MIKSTSSTSIRGVTLMSAEGPLPGPPVAIAIIASPQEAGLPIRRDQSPHTPLTRGAAKFIVLADYQPAVFSARLKVRPGQRQRCERCQPQSQLCRTWLEHRL